MSSGACRDRESVSDPGTYICIRRTLDWEDEALVQEGLRPDFRPKFDAWNATFDVPYHTFRHRLKQIARLSLERVVDATCASLDEVPPGGIVVPVDDDDWLAPDLANRIRQAYDPSVRVILWSLHLIELPRRTTLRFWPVRWREPRLRCSTNNYAIQNLPELRPLFSSHMRATEYSMRHSDQIARLPDTLSIQNRNMSSQTAMAWRQPSITREQLITSYRRYRTLYDSLALPPELAWARPYVDSMAELMRNIHIK